MAQPQPYRSAVRRLLRLIGGQPPPAAPDERRLECFRQFMDGLGAPHAHGRFVHIAGSKGKGSTARMLDAILRAAGRSTLLFTSPALHTMNERIRLSGAPADPHRFADAAEQVLAASPPNFFGALTAIAFLLHRENRPDFTILETGLGGRLDPTNIVSPELSVITRVELEHTDVLGGTIPLIAREKAGIIKPAAPVVSAPQHPAARAVIAQRAAELDAPLIEVPPDAVRLLEAGIGSQRARFKQDGAQHDFNLPLMGAHQLQNAAVAIAAANRLGVGAADIAAGLERVEAHGCAQLVPGTPPLIADGCHTPLSARALAEALRQHLGLRGGAAVIFGTTGGHATLEALRELKQLGAQFIPVRARHPKSLPAEKVARLMRRAGIASAGPASSVAAALKTLQGADLPAVIACGSIAVAAEALQAAAGIPSDF